MQVKRQQRHQQVKGEEQQEICCTHLNKVSIPQFLTRLRHGKVMIALIIMVLSLLWVNLYGLLAVLDDNAIVVLVDPLSHDVIDHSVTLI